MQFLLCYTLYNSKLAIYFLLLQNIQEPQSSDTDDSADDSCTTTVSTWKPGGKTNTRENGKF